LVTTLRAAEKFDQSHLSSPAVAPLVDAAKIFYVEGYLLTHGTESVLELAKKASVKGKVSCSKQISIEYELIWVVLPDLRP
jgi:adenosine kinase